MYSTCIFCNSELGKNEAIEEFPVGRRLAFDAAKGRLWVVCRNCERWNLSPLEERWEAIEAAERLFADTRLRVSTDNIGLAKVRDGTTLIRIGSAQRPEMAAWRYGDQFGRRRRRHVALTALGVAAVAGVAIVGPATGVIAGGGWGLWQGITTLHDLYQKRRVRVQLRDPETDTLVPIRKNQLDHTSIIRTEDGSWGLRVSMRKPTKDADELSEKKRIILFTGKDALRAAGKLFPAVNETGAKSNEVQSAVRIVTEAGQPDELFRRYATQPRVIDLSRGELSRTKSSEDRMHLVARLPKEVRLALEMAAHEEQERRALEGELAVLEAAWREAEEVARIADDMFLPDDSLQRFDDLKKRSDS